MNITYCLACAQPYTKISDTQYRCPQGHEFWNNPHAAVGVIVYNQKGEILFSKRAHEPRKGWYDFPGGFCEYNESPLTAAQREITEETGLTIDELELIAAYPGIYVPNDSVCDLIILARKYTGTPKPDDDSEALEWHAPDFIDGPTFSPDYPGLSEILLKIIPKRV